MGNWNVCVRKALWAGIWLVGGVWAAALSAPVYAQNDSLVFQTVQTFSAEEAHQGVAVDANYFYAVGSRQIGKYEKTTGRRVARWEEVPEGPVTHLDSGVIVDGKLYAAHSNFPSLPMTSSVEIWDAKTLQHIGSHSFGIRWGSCTWVDRHNGNWWAVFAHYQRFKKVTGKDNRWTTLVKFTDDWQPLESWVFPEKVLERFDGMSNSGGSWGPDGRLYVSGHDRPELYVLKLPQAGSTLELVGVASISNEGQGVAWDRSQDQTIYAIQRDSRKVIRARLQSRSSLPSNR